MLPLDVSPVATFLVGLAERRASGSVTLVSRALHLLSGELSEMDAASADPSFGDFLVQSERLTDATLREIQSKAKSSGISFESALVAHGRLSRAECKSLLRACWLDRFVRELRSAQSQPKLLPTLDVTQQVSSHSPHTVPLLPFVLDAWTRIAVDADAAAVGVRIDFRLVWVEGPLLEIAQRWASLPDVLDRPVVSTVLGRVPAAAAEIAALVRTGFVRLAAPGGQPTKPRSRKDTLPPPAPRLVTLAEVAQLPATPLPPPPIVLAKSSAPPPPRSPLPRAPRPRTPPPQSPLPAAPSTRAPRIQLQPGGAGHELEPLPQLELREWPSDRTPLPDPLRELELQVARLEESKSDGRQRARVFVQLAALWQSRLGSLEHATRALREAAAADPDDTQVLLQTARQCGSLGEASLALAYARAVAFTAGSAAERAAGHRVLAQLYASQGDSDRSLEGLSEAAAEDPENPEPHELLAQLQYERGNATLAIAHAQRAAVAYSGRASKRSLGWHALAYAWDPSDAVLAENYRNALDAAGLVDAAVAFSAETARGARDPETRRHSRMETADFARARGRADLSAELLSEIFDEDASCVGLYPLLDADFSQAGLSSEHTAVLETIARVSGPAQRTRWLTRYSKLMEALPDSTELTQRGSALAKRYAALSSAGPGPEIEAYIAELESGLSALDDSAGDEERAVLAELCRWHLLAGDARRAITCAQRLLVLSPADTLAAARLCRAAALVKDANLQREALVALARAQSGTSQARSLAVLARLLERSGEFDAALECAEATLSALPTAADAALIVLRHAHRLAPPRAAAVLAGLQPLLHTCPTLSMARAEAARACGDREAALEALHELSSDMPLLFEPRLIVLELQAEHDEPGPLMAAALALLAISHEPSHVARAEAAVMRLVELGAPGPAARLSQHILESRSKSDLAYATSAAELARVSGDVELTTLALERVVSMLHGPAQVESLAGVAAHHRQHGDRVAEVRAWLRVIALAAGHPRALEELTRLFAECGDIARLLVVMSIGLEASTDPDARRQRLLDMASAAAHVGGDRDRAAQYIAALLAESVEDRQWLRVGVSALFALGDTSWATQQARQLCEALPAAVAADIYLWCAHRAERVANEPGLALELAAEGARRFPGSGELLLIAERLSLATRDRTTAVALYADLIEDAIGDHGKRALAYRAGRWLERTGSYDEALAHYTHAFELAKTTGVAYKALERAARASRKLAPLAQAQETLAELAIDDRSRLGLLRDAARTSLVDLDDPERGFRNLLKADAIATVGELDGALTEAAQKLGERDEDAGARALLELAETRQARAEQLWEADPKAKLLLNAAKLHLHTRNDPEASAAALAPLMAEDFTSELSSDLHADSLLTLAEAKLGSGRPEEALEAVEKALSVKPDAPGAIELKTRITSPPPPRPSASSGAVAIQLDEQSAPEHDRPRTHEDHARLLDRVRAEPIDIATLRALHTEAEALGAQPESLVAAQVLSLFDPAVEPPQQPAFRAELMLPDEVFNFVHGEADPELRQLTRLLWECVRAVPQLRRTPEDFDLQPGERAGLDDRTGFAGAFNRIARLLDRTETTLYVRKSALQILEVLPTHPPCVVARAGSPVTPVQRFRLATALVLAEPEHAVAGILKEHEGRELVAALLGAFGPPGSDLELSRTGKDLASQLWHAVPVRVQAQLRELVKSRLDVLPYDQLRRDVQLCGARAGLLVSRDLRTAIESFATLEPELDGIDIRIERGFEEAYSKSAALREVIRAAFSESYLALAGLRAA
jgi:tetratricopeptide (TPR) repeat protein